MIVQIYVNNCVTVRNQLVELLIDRDDNDHQLRQRHLRYSSHTVVQQQQLNVATTCDYL